MTRLAYLCTDPGIGYGTTKGAAVHVSEIVTALARQGAEVLLMMQAGSSEAPVPRGVTLEALPGPGRGASVAERLAAESVRARWIEQRLGVFGAGALLERLALHSAAGATAASELGIPHLVELNAPLPREAAAYRRLEQPDAALHLERATLAGAGLVLAVSRPLARYARARGAHRAEVMPNAVALERFPDPAPLPRGGPPHAIFCGSLRPWHGVDVIAEAWELLGAAAPPLMVIGDGPGSERLAQAGAEIMGPVSHGRVPTALAGAEIGLVTYARDAPDYFSPLKLFEYLAAGLAVVAAEVPGVCEVVDARSAALVEPGNPVALAERVSRLAEDHQTRRRLGQAGRELVARHTWERRARRILAAVHELGGAAALAGAAR